MPRITNVTSLTRKSQLTLPKKVREHLKVGPGDRIGFKIEGNEVKVYPVPSLLEQNFGKVQPKKKPEDFKKLRRRFEKRVAEEVVGEYR